MFACAGVNGIHAVMCESSASLLVLVGNTIPSTIADRFDCPILGHWVWLHTDNTTYSQSLYCILTKTYGSQQAQINNLYLFIMEFSVCGLEQNTFTFKKVCQDHLLTQHCLKFEISGVIYIFSLYDKNILLFVNVNSHIINILIYW